MRFVYGRHHWVSRERGQENCYLLTNGLGGFSGASMIGSNTRNDHALLMACLHAPNDRYNMVHRLKEQVVRDDGKRDVYLSSQEYVDERRNEDGHVRLSAFCFEDAPKWVYDVDGVEIIKRIAMRQGENLVAVKYWIDNQSAHQVSLHVTPQLQFVPKGSSPRRDQQFTLTDGCISSNGLSVFFQTNGEVCSFPQAVTEGLYYAQDACDGRMCEGITHANHRIIKHVPGHTCEVLELLYYMEKTDDEKAYYEKADDGKAYDGKAGDQKEYYGKADDQKEYYSKAVCGKGNRITADQVFEEAEAYRRELARVSGMRCEAAKMLVKSADQFIAERESTGGKTMLAGFPFFEDWGRDTMIAMAGCCISTRQFGTAKSILRTFAAYCKDGLMPNLFPEGQNEPQYNTADAALLYIHAVYLYINKTKDIQFLREIWTVMEEIICCYKNGTSYGIHMDTDGLLFAGEKLDQVTWMDVRIGDILPTPRHGKPVEINAYWYNALCIMKECESLLKADGSAGKAADDYGAMAKLTKKSFREKFWCARNNCLKDVLSGTDADEQIRCNQIWAVSLPFTMLDKEKERQVVDTVFEKLYTPYGLRTLDPADAQFHGTYGGSQMERDLAYHQGTVWVFPLGAYYLAYLKTRNYEEDAVKKVAGQLEVLESALGEGCIGQLPEIYDGNQPSFSRGCYAQAWSVGEILRVYEALQL